MMYEDLGLIEPYRTATNRRRYSQRNVRKLQVIQQLTREKGVNLAGVEYILMLLESLKNGSVMPADDLKQVYDVYEEIISLAAVGGSASRSCRKALAASYQSSAY